MAIAVDDFLTACLLALGDSGGATWSRTDRILVWASEAVRFFPLLQTTARRPHRRPGQGVCIRYGD